MTTEVSWWRITRNILSLSLRELLNKGTYLFLGIMIARSLGEVAFGDYALSLLLSRTFFTFGDLGFGTWVVREVSQAREKTGRYFATLGTFRILAGLGAVLVLGGFLILSGYGLSLKRHILLSSCAFFFIHLMSFIFAFFRSFEKMGAELEVSLVKNALFIGGGLWAISKGSLDLLFHVFIVSSAIAFFYALFLYQRRIGWQGVQWEAIHFGGMMPIWLIQSLGMIYLYLDTVLLSFFRGIAEVGLYQAAYSFVDLLLVLSTILTTALFPVFSRLAKHSLKDLTTFYEEAFRAVLFFLVPCAFLALFGAGTLLSLFYGPSFQKALPALYFLLSGSLFFIFGGLNGHLLLALGKEKSVLGVIVFCAAANLLLNLWAIPRFGFLGASVTTLFSELVMFSLMLCQIMKRLGTGVLLGGGSFLWVCLLWLPCLWSLVRLSFWIQLPLGFGIYFLLAYFLRRKLSRELHAVTTLWKELRGTVSV